MSLKQPILKVKINWYISMMPAVAMTQVTVITIIASTMVFINANAGYSTPGYVGYLVQGAIYLYITLFFWFFFARVAKKSPLALIGIR